MKKVSVILPCLNGERYIVETIESLKSQTYKILQVVFVDNGSTDTSVRIAREATAGDARFRFVKESRKGIARALNRGVREATGEIIAFLDMDDFYHKHSIQRIVEEFEATKADFIACNGHLINEKSEIYGEFDPYGHSAEMAPLILFQKNIIWTMSFLSVRRSSLAAQHLFRDEYDWIPDLHLILNCISQGLKVWFLDEPLVCKRYHRQNIAYNSDVIEPQCIRRLLKFKEDYPRISEFFTEEHVRRILTDRYIRAVQYLRRKDLWSKIPGYLGEYVRAGYIHENIYNYFNALALMQTDRQAFFRFMAEKKSRHPIWCFARGLMHWTRKEFQSACVEFEAAYVRALLRFPEALNSLALASFFADRSRSGRLINQVLKHWPDYQDAKINRVYVLEGRPDLFRHSVALMPDTLTYLSSLSP